MTTALEDMSVAELDALIAEASRKRDETREKRRKELKAEIETKIRVEGFTVAEVLGPRTRPEALPPRYADETGRTWSGKGRMPHWLQERVDKGEPLDGFRIRNAKA